MHHFIVRQRQHEVFGVVVEQPEGELIVVILTINRVELHVVERVVHPAEVPLVPEAQAAHCRWTGNAREVGGLFRHGHGAFHLLADNAVGVAQKLNRFQVFTAAILVRDPLPLFAAVVAVDHRRHRIHAQGINAETFDPVQRVPDQVVRYFTATVVIDQRIPVLVIAFARVAVLVQLCAVELCQRKIIRRAVARHPVEDHVQPGGVRGIDEIAEVIARAEAARGRIQPGWLIAPAAVKWVFVDRQQLQMGKAHPFGVRHQLVRQLAIAQPEVVIGVATPRAEMHFIDGDWRIKAVGLLALLTLDNLLRQAANQRGGIRA